LYSRGAILPLLELVEAKFGGGGGHGPLKSAYAINIVSKVTYHWSLVVVWLAEPV